MSRRTVRTLLLLAPWLAAAPAAAQTARDLPPAPVARVIPRTDTLHGDVLADNNRMLNLMQRCGFQLSPHPHDDALLRAEFDLAAAPQNNGSWWAALAFLFPARAPFFQAA